MKGTPEIPVITAPGVHDDQWARIAQLADEEALVLVDTDCAPDPHAVRHAVRVMAENGGAVAYGDVIEPDGSIAATPAFDPFRLVCHDYLGPVLVIRPRSLRQILDTSDRTTYRVWRHDVLLAASRASAGIVHTGRALASVDTAKRHSDELDTDERSALDRVLTRHLMAEGGGTVGRIGLDGVHQVYWTLDGSPTVSIVIPTRAQRAPDGSSLLVRAVQSIAEKTSHGAWEVVLVVDAQADHDVLDEATRLLAERGRVVRWNAPFNFSAKVNLGVAHSRGEFVALLNDDIEVISPNWLDSMLALAQRPGVGMVGAKLYFEDNTIQHAGHHYWHGDATHIGLGAPRDAPGPLDGFRVDRRVAGVTAACAVMRRDVFDEVGGLDEGLPGAFNDVDLCLKTTWAGYDIVWTPHAELYHFESKTRDATVRQFEVDRHWQRWAFRMHQPEYWPFAADGDDRSRSRPLGSLDR